MSHKNLTELEEEEEIEDIKLSIWEKRAAIREAKKTYGRDYIRIIGKGVHALLSWYKSHTTPKERAQDIEQIKNQEA